MTRLGALALATAGVLFFAGQLVVQAAWTTPFSWVDNTISDLGETTAPWHTLMNTVFVVNGALIALGAVTTRRGLTRVLLVAAAIGCALVGLAPADAYDTPHVLGAALVFVLGNLGMLATRRPLPVVFGVVGLVATALFAAGHVAAERVAVYPLFVWFVIDGVSGSRPGTPEGTSGVPGRRSRGITR